MLIETRSAHSVMVSTKVQPPRYPRQTRRVTASPRAVTDTPFMPGTRHNVEVRSRIIIITGVFLAFGALVLGAMYDAPTEPAAIVQTGSAADGGGERDAETAVLDVSPVEGWFPQTGVGSTCTEPVGIDLLPGYAAILVINGEPIPDNELNIYDNPDAPPGERVLTASGALGRYTWGPEEDCPNGRLLRPEGNSVSACVYRIEQGPNGCRQYGPFEFDAL